MLSASLRPILILLMVGVGSGALRAQNYLVVQVKGQGKVVRKISEPVMYVVEDGQLKGVRGERTGLVPAPEFMPVFVAVRDVDARTTALDNDGNLMNNDFRFRATFESPDRLADVFFVLELELKRGGKKRIHSQGVGDLEPRKPRTISVTVPMMGDLGEGRYELHVFSEGMEVFSSAQPAEFREHALDRMVAKRIEGLQDSLPTPLVGPAPEYPKHLVKARTKGEAVVKVHISTTGLVADPQVASATDPAFGEAAVAAVRQWRFVPRIKEGRPVETMAEVPFAFEPPGPSQKN